MKKIISICFLLVFVIQLRAQTELVIPNGDRNIYGVLASPDSVSVKKVAIISHGFNGTHEFGESYFQTLNDLGYAVYSFDFPCGSVRSRSDNNTMNMSVLDEVSDLKAIVGYFRAQGDVDTTNIILIGESQGGLVSALAAASLKEQIRRLVLIYPALCIPDDWRARYATEADIPDTTDVWGVPVGRRFFLQLRDLDVFDAIAGYESPVLIIHGSRDQVVSLHYSERAKAVYHNARIRVIFGAGHGFSPEQRTSANQFIRNFLAAD